MFVSGIDIETFRICAFNSHLDSTLQCRVRKLNYKCRAIMSLCTRDTPRNRLFCGNRLVVKVRISNLQQIETYTHVYTCTIRARARAHNVRWIVGANALIYVR